MNLVVFERDKDYVRDRLRAGEIDYLETVSEGAGRRSLNISTSGGF